MQTFLPYSDFQTTAECLDYRRLGKQRIEAKQIYFALTDDSKRGWKNHPAVKMWKGFESALLKYGQIITLEWIRKGYKDNQLDFFTTKLSSYATINYPEWLEREDIILGYRSNLLRKNPQYYSKFGWSVPDNLEYVWPE